MDLMEYQAKELFAKHGVTTTLGTVVTTADVGGSEGDGQDEVIVAQQHRQGLTDHQPQQHTPASRRCSHRWVWGAQQRFEQGGPGPGWHIEQSAGVLVPAQVLKRGMPRTCFR